MSGAPMYFWRRVVTTRVAHLTDVRGPNPRRIVCGGELVPGLTLHAPIHTPRPALMEALGTGRHPVDLCPACLEQEPSL